MQFETKASDAELKFAGFKMGMSKEEILELLRDESIYLVYGESDRYVKLFYAPNKDTLYWDKNDNCLCTSELLVDKNSWDSTWNNGGGITKIVFSDWILEYPTLIFEKNHLIKLSTTVGFKYEDYLIFYTNLKSKYGSPVKKKYGNASYLEWSSKNDVFRISDYTHLINNKSYMANTGNSIKAIIQFYQQVNRIECVKIKEENKIAFFKNLVSINQGSLKVSGLSLGMKKHEVEYQLNVQLENNDYSNTSINGIIISRGEFLISGFNGENFSLYLEFYDDKLSYVELGPRKSYIGYKRNFILLKELIAFYSKRLNDDKIKVYYGQRDLYYDSILFVNHNSELNIYHDTRYPPYISITLKSSNQINEVRNQVVMPIKLKFQNMIKNVKESCIGGFKLFSEFKVDNDLRTSNEFDIIDPNVYQNCFITSPRVNDSRKQCVSETEESSLLSIHPTIIVCDSYITSISLNYFLNSEYLEISRPLSMQLKSLFPNVFIDELTNMYGAPNICSLKERKSLYWHIDGLILELLNTTPYDRVAISFRKYTPNDLILKKSKTRNLLE